MAWTGERKITTSGINGIPSTSASKPPQGTETTGEPGETASVGEQTAAVPSPAKRDLKVPESKRTDSAAPGKRKSWRGLIVLLILVLLGVGAGAYFWFSWNGEEGHPGSGLSRWWRERTQVTTAEKVDGGESGKSFWRVQVDKALEATSRWRDRSEGSKTPEAAAKGSPEALQEAIKPAPCAVAAIREEAESDVSVDADPDGADTVADESLSGWPQLMLNAVVGRGRNGVVQLNGKLLRVGETTADGVTLVSVEAQTAFFRWQDQTRRVTVGDDQREDF